MEQKLTVPELVDTHESLPLKSRREAERRQLTILFCDLVGSTALSDRLEPEAYRQIIIDYHRLAEKVIKRLGGHIAQYLGDGLLVYFGYPKGLEDAPNSAVRAGLGILEAVEEANKQLEKEGKEGKEGKEAIKVRIGIHTGLVVVDDHLALGKTTNIAARLEGLAPENGLVISPETLKLVQGWFETTSIGTYQLKGISKPTDVYQVLHESGARTRIDIARRKGLSPLIGRKKERDLLWKYWEEAKKGKGSLTLIVGEAGIGKSRLVDAFKLRVAEEPKSWLTEIRCSSYHINSPLYPIIDFLENAILQYDSVDDTRSKLVKLEGFLVQTGFDLQATKPLFAEYLSLSADDLSQLNISPGAKKQKMIKALVESILHRASIQPVLLVIEDLHWADVSTLEWLEFLYDQLSVHPILVLCTTRPTFQLNWTKSTRVTQITLDRLEKTGVEDICNFIAKGKSFPMEMIDQIYQKTEGVPLFVEELTKMVIESGQLIEKEDQYELAGPISTLTIPSTLQDSLIARLDRFSAVKDIVQTGAVIGREFSFSLLTCVLDHDQKWIQRELNRLVRAEILTEKGVEKLKVYMFKHALIRDAAYEVVLKRERRKIHKRVADVLEYQFLEIKQAQPELLGYHYEKAGLTEKSISYWLRAGESASQKHAIQEAISHLNTGLNLLESAEDEVFRKKLALDFHLLLGGAYIVYCGYAHPKVLEVFSKSIELAKSIEASDELAYILYGLMVYYLIKEDYHACYDLIDYSLKLGEEEKGGYLFKLFGKHLAGLHRVQ